jgi:hypothetical protein
MTRSRHIFKDGGCEKCGLPWSEHPAWQKGRHQRLYTRLAVLGQVTLLLVVVMLAWVAVKLLVINPEHRREAQARQVHQRYEACLRSARTIIDVNFCEAYLEHSSPTGPTYAPVP